LAKVLVRWPTPLLHLISFPNLVVRKLVVSRFRAPS
jgi:hypothetical protein